MGFAPTPAKTQKTFLFFVLVYILSIPFWLLSAWTKNTNLPLQIPIGDVIAAFLPLFVAALLTYKQHGRKAVGALLRRVGDIGKITPKKWLPIVSIPLIIYGFTYGALWLFGYEIPYGSTISVIDTAALVLFFYAGAIGEEVGYTAYLTDPLLRRFGTFWTALLIGVPWALWHVPSMLVQGRNLVWIFWGIAGTVAVRYIYVWLYERTGGAVSAIIAMHVIFNAGRVLFPHTNAVQPLIQHEELYYAIIILFALFIGIRKILLGRKQQA